MELPPCRTVDEALNYDLLQWKPIANAISGDALKALGQTVLLGQPEDCAPMSIYQLGTAFRHAQGSDSPPLKYPENRSAVEHIRRWVAQEGLAEEPTPGGFVPTAAGRKAVGFIGVCADWQLAHPDLPLDIIAGFEAPRGKPSELPYTFKPIATLRIAQLLLGAETLPVSELSEQVPGRTELVIRNDLRRLWAADVLYRPDVGSRVRYGLCDEARPVIGSLLRGIASLDDDDYRDRATAFAIDLAHTRPADARRYLAVRDRRTTGDTTEHALRSRRVPQNPSKDPTLPLWFDDVLDGAKMANSRKHEMYTAVSKIWAAGVIQQSAHHPEGFAFSNAVSELFNNNEPSLRAVARCFGLEKRIFGDVQPEDVLKAGLGLRVEDSLMQYAKTELVPRLTQYEK